MKLFTLKAYKYVHKYYVNSGVSIIKIHCSVLKENKEYNYHSYIAF